MQPNPVQIRGRIQPTLQRLLSDQSGAILALVTIMSLLILGLTGFVVDLGLGFVSKAQMSRAVDAGVLAGARNLRSGTSVAEAQALALAEVNGVSGGGASLNVGFGQNAEGEATVTMTASRPMPTIFIRALGTSQLNVGSAAMAAVPPVDLVMVLDQSGSLDRNNAFDDLQDASKDFLQHFDDDLDQIGLVSFQLRGTDRFLINHGFTLAIENQIDGMISAGDTNAGEGLRLALLQMQGPAVRERSAKVIVFFTDGRPTAFRGALGNGGPFEGGSALGPFSSGIPGVEDRMMAVFTTNSGRVRGYFDDPDGLPTDGTASPSGCNYVSSCWGWNESEVRDKGRDAGLEVANAIRAGSIYIYSIGLGDPGATPMEQPDMDYLREISNEGGATDPGQPSGRAYFAPSPNELEAVFNQVAQDLLVRLAQ